MTREQWRLADRIPGAVASATALTEQQLAARLDASVGDVHRVVAMLTGRGLLDRCWTGTEAYLVLPLPASGQGVSAA